MSAAKPGVMRAVLALTGAFIAQAQAACERPVYLTFDTGHMGVADVVADVLKRHEVPATFFLARAILEQQRFTPLGLVVTGSTDGGDLIPAVERPSPMPTRTRKTMKWRRSKRCASTTCR